MDSDHPWPSPLAKAQGALRASDSALLPNRRTSGFVHTPCSGSKEKGAQGPFFFGVGGEGGIRTHEHLAMLLDFQSSAFDHSATSPARSAMISSLWRLGRQDVRGRINTGGISRSWRLGPLKVWDRERRAGIRCISPCRYFERLIVDRIRKIFWHRTLTLKERPRLATADGDRSEQKGHRGEWASKARRRFHGLEGSRPTACMASRRRP